MLRSYIRAAASLKQLRTDAEGVVSFEYVVLAACIIAVVGTAFSASSGSITTTLTNAVATVCAALATAVGS